MNNTFFLIFTIAICKASFSQEKQQSIEINETKKEAIFKCYPNPVEDELYILGTYKIKSIELFDALGNRVAIYHYKKSIIKMDLSNLKSGVYHIKVINENEVEETKKLFIK